VNAAGVERQMRARRATVGDAEAIAAIYNEGIADGIATFETRLRTADDVTRWFGGRFPIVVVEDPVGVVIAFASTSEYRARECYAGVAEFSVYVARSARRRGAGRTAMERLMETRARRDSGSWSRVCSSRIWQAVRCCATSGSARSASTNGMRNCTAPGATSSSSNGRSRSPDC
jgi:L-amino acid N-acyltransferase YncA